MLAIIHCYFYFLTAHNLEDFFSLLEVHTDAETESSCQTVFQMFRYGKRIRETSDLANMQLDNVPAKALV